MPRVYLSRQEKEQAALKRKQEKENFMLRAIMRDKICRKIGYEYICEKTKLSQPTVSKIVNRPEDCTIEQIRLVCAAAEIPLIITVENINCS